MLEGRIALDGVSHAGLIALEQWLCTVARSVED